MRITRENTIGLLIDIQERLFAVMSEKDQLARNSRILTEGLQELGVPLVVTQQYTKGLGETIEPLKAVIRNFNPVEKREFSCLDCAQVSDLLKGAKTVLIYGIESHVCVLQTAVDLKDAGYIPVIVMDCVSSRSTVNVRLAAERFRHEGIMMTSCESVLFELTRSSTDPAFRRISGLVK